MTIDNESETRKCPAFIDWMCPVCGIITGEIHGYHPFAKGIGIDKVMASFKNPSEPQETRENRK